MISLLAAEPSQLIENISEHSTQRFSLLHLPSVEIGTIVNREAGHEVAAVEDERFIQECSARVAELVGRMTVRRTLGAQMAEPVDIELETGCFVERDSVPVGYDP